MNVFYSRQLHLVFREVDRVPAGPVQDAVHGADEVRHPGSGVARVAGRAVEGGGGAVVLAGVVTQGVAPPDLLGVGGLERRKEQTAVTARHEWKVIFDFVFVVGVLHFLYSFLC